VSADENLVWMIGDYAHAVLLEFQRSATISTLCLSPAL